MALMRYQPQGLQRRASTALARGLVMAYHGGAGTREALSGSPMTSRGSAQAIKGFPGGLAYDLRVVNAGAYFSATRVAPQLVSDQSLVFDLIINGAPSGSVPSLGGIWRSTTQNDAWLVIDRDTADTLQVNFRIAGVGSNRVFNIGASSLYGRRLVVAASITRGQTGSGTVYLRVAADGALLYDLSSTYTGNGSTDVTPTGTEYISIGSESIENPSRNCNAINYAQYHFGRNLSSDEVASLSAQKWQLFADAYEDDEFTSAAVGQIYAFAASGIVQMAGAAPFRRGLAKAANGGAVLAGSGTMARGAARTSTGGANLAGVAAVSTSGIQQRAFAATGGVSIAGAAQALRRATRATIGGAKLTGTSFSYSAQAGAIETQTPTWLIKVRRRGKARVRI